MTVIYFIRSEVLSSKIFWCEKTYILSRLACNLSMFPPAFTNIFVALFFRRVSFLEKALIGLAKNPWALSSYVLLFSSIDYTSFFNCCAPVIFCITLRRSGLKLARKASIWLDVSNTVWVRVRVVPWFLLVPELLKLIMSSSIAAYWFWPTNDSDFNEALVNVSNLSFIPF